MILTRAHIDYIIKRIPIIGILLFVGLYIFSSKLYPGGSQVNLDSVGFDWINNYWCNLMNKKGMNGQLNPARPFAILASIILSFSLMIFFIQFAKTLVKAPNWKIAINFFGVFSMLASCLLFTPYHDTMTTTSSLFGVVVVIGIIRTIYKSDLQLFKNTGILCILLLGLNNYIYYSGNYIEILPLLQKVTFVIVLTWIVGLNHHMIYSK